MPKVSLYAWREFKPLRDTIEISVYLKNQAGEKSRHDLEIPMDFFRTQPGFDEETAFNENLTIEIVPIPWDGKGRRKPEDYQNLYHETFYHMLKPLDTWQETALRYYRDHPRYPDSDDMTDEELLEKVLSDDPKREEHWIWCWEREHTEDYLKRYDRYLRLLEEFPEDFNKSLEKFNAKKWNRGVYVGEFGEY